MSFSRNRFLLSGGMLQSGSCFNGIVGTALSNCFYRISGRKTVHTFAGNALALAFGDEAGSLLQNIGILAERRQQAFRLGNEAGQLLARPVDAMQ